MKYQSLVWVEILSRLKLLPPETKIIITIVPAKYSHSGGNPRGPGNVDIVADTMVKHFKGLPQCLLRTIVSVVVKYLR